MIREIGAAIMAEQREIACRMLAELGYRAEAVSSGEAANAVLTTPAAITAATVAVSICFVFIVLSPA